MYIYIDNIIVFVLFIFYFYCSNTAEFSAHSFVKYESINAVTRHVVIFI